VRYQVVKHALQEALAEYGDSVTCVTALADGADQLFARAVIDQGRLILIEVIVPAAQYRDGLLAESHTEYDDLLGHAITVHRLELTESASPSHMAASKLMISELFAVWDQQPARGYGGTADVIAQAREQGRPVRIIWPDGASRD
jgi:hypothetical protein